MPLTDKDANAFILFLIKTFVVVVGLRILLMFTGISIHVPYLDPLIFKCGNYIRSLGSSGMSLN